MNDPKNFTKLNLVELERLASTWAEEYPITEKITLYSAKIPPHSGKEPKTHYVFIARICKPPHRKDPGYQNYKNFIEWTGESCLHIQNELEWAYNEAPLGYHLEWAWFNLEPGDELPTEFISLKYPWILYEREDQPCSVASTAEPSTVEASTSKDIDDFPENHINSFNLIGDYWDIRYQGEETRIRNLERICYIIHLLDNPGVEFSSHSLTSLVKGNKPLSDKYYSKLSEEQLQKEGLTQGETLTDPFSGKDYEDFKKIVHILWERSITSQDDEKAQADWENCKNIAQNEYGTVVDDSGKKLKFFKVIHNIIFWG